MSRGPLTLFRGGTGEQIFTGEASPAPDPGATSFDPVVLAFTYADLLAVIGTGIAYLPVATLADGDVVLVAGTEVTEVFDDTGGITLQLSEGAGDPLISGVTPLETAVHTDTILTPDQGMLGMGRFSAAGFDGSEQTTISSAVVQQGAGPVGVFVTAGILNGDGATGKGIARCLIVRAP